MYQMVVEISRWTNTKMEIAIEEPLNLIKQDQKNEILRYVRNSFSYKGYVWNYQMIPQTWGDSNQINEATDRKGENDSHIRNWFASRD
jgi:inorganic pyrophosphatase